MIRSMTGFGRVEFDVEGTGFAAEVRTVNHRHLDVSARLPRMASAFELPARKAVQSRFGRGKVDVSVQLAPGQAIATEVEIDEAVAQRYVAFAEELAERRGTSAELPVAALLGLPGVARSVEHALSPEALEAALLAAVVEASEQAARMRAREGEALDAELRQRLETVSRIVAEIEPRAGEVVAAARERLRKRAEQLRDETGVLDEARLHQEVVLAADRLDVTEEIVRLRSHVSQFLEVLGGDDAEPVGRRLDFLLQEMGREANTIGSKASDAALAHRVVDLKTELERIREQVQNVE